MKDQVKAFEGISANLKRLRAERGLSASEVSRRVGVAESTYREWEYGRKIIGEPYLDLARCFGVSLSELMCGEAARSELALDLDRIEALIQGMKSRL